MARPQKIGLDYFPFDIDFFADEKTEAISGQYGIVGEITIIKILCLLYRKGYYIKWDRLIKMKLIKYIPGITENTLDNIVNSLIEWEFFDKVFFESDKILTSKGIQNRYHEATRRRKIEGITIYSLIEVENDNINVDTNLVNVDINSVNVDRNEIVNVDRNYASTVLNDNISTQKKVKESKLINPTEVDKSTNLLKNNDLDSSTTSLKNPPKQTETILPATIPPLPDKDIDRQENRPATGKRTGRAKKPPDLDAEPYWKELVSIWFSFCYENFKSKPTFSGQHPKQMKEIILALKQKTVDDGKVWNEQEAKLRWRGFLGRAITDKFFKDLFILSHLNKFKDKIFFNQSTNSNGQKGKTGSGGHGSFNRLAVGSSIVFDKP